MSARLELLDQATGRVLLERPLQPADLALCGSEFWREQFLRCGRPDVTFEDLDLALVLGRFVPGLDRGFALRGRVRDSAEPWARLEFLHSALQVVWLDMTAALMKGGTPDPDARVTGRIVIDAGGLPLGDAFRRPGVTYRPPALLRYPLRRFPEPAKPEAPWPAPFPVYYLAGAREDAERFARLGAAQSPPVETGCFLLGHPCSCPESGELFLVITEALLIEGAEAGPYHMEMTGRAWASLQAILRRRRESGSVARPVGFAHGHPFLPGMDASACPDCARRKECDVTSVFMSEEDRRWMASVFAHRRPWQVAHVFGLDARGGPAEGLYGLEGGAWAARTYNVISRRPDDFPTSPGEDA